MAVFITVEGGEGVGKSTFIKGLERLLVGSGHKVRVTFEPGGTEIASRIRSIFVNPPEGETLTSEAELLLVSAARSQHVERLIVPSLANGETIISDRFADSSRVYQGVLGSLGMEAVDRMTEFVCKDVKPDITFLLDCDVEVAMKRLSPRNQSGGPGSRENEQASRFDSAKKEVHEKIRSGFLKVAEKESDRFCILDASQSPKSVLEQAREHLSARNIIS